MFSISVIVTALIFVFIGLAGWVLTEGTDHWKTNRWSGILIQSGCVAVLTGLAMGCVELLIAIW